MGCLLGHGGMPKVVRACLRSWGRVSAHGACLRQWVCLRLWDVQLAGSSHRPLWGFSSEGCYTSLNFGLEYSSVMEHLNSMYKVLSSIPSTAEKGVQDLPSSTLSGFLLEM
jgi:hypothetical protein